MASACRAMPRARAMDCRRSPVSTMSLLAWASCAPWASAIDTSAPASTGASFTPSPMASTRAPPARRLASQASLSAGSWRARHSRTFSSEAMRDTRDGASPLAMSTVRPCSRRASIAHTASARSRSLNRKRRDGSRHRPRVSRHRRIHPPCLGPRRRTRRDPDAARGPRPTRTGRAPRERSRRWPHRDPDAPRASTRAMG